MAKCKGCGAEIEWVKLTSGKMHPVNKKLITIVSEIEDEFGNGQGVSEIIRGYESHFAMCPKADTFRNREKGREDNAGKIIRG